MKLQNLDESFKKDSKNLDEAAGMPASRHCIIARH
jgi:hypothetical protein